MSLSSLLEIDDKHRCDVGTPRKFPSAMDRCWPVIHSRRILEDIAENCGSRRSCLDRWGQARWSKNSSSEFFDHRAWPHWSWQLDLDPQCLQCPFEMKDVLWYPSRLNHLLAMFLRNFLDWISDQHRSIVLGNFLGLPTSHRCLSSISSKLLGDSFVFQYRTSITPASKCKYRYDTSIIRY